MIRTRSMFEEHARLLLPVDPEIGGRVLRASADWSGPPTDTDMQGSAVVIWGREAKDKLEVVPDMRRAVRRELSLAAMHRRHLRELVIHRVAPTPSQSRARESVRRALLGGVIVELWTSAPVPRLVDVALEAAGLAAGETTLAFGASGAAIGRGRRGSHEVIARVGLAGSTGDPRRGAEALATLADAGLREVPGLVSVGTSDTAAWSVEELLPGRPVRRLRMSMISQLSAFLAALPASDTRPTAHDHHLRRIAAALPTRRDVLERVSSEITGRLSTVPSVVCHGDLWRSNLLAQRGHVTGVVDWDNWHPFGAPGVDVLHLLGSEEKIHRKVGLRDVWLDSPWRRAEFRELGGPLWEHLGWRPSREEAEAIGLSWWASEVSGALGRAGRDERWVEENVDELLRVVAV